MLLRAIGVTAAIALVAGVRWRRQGAGQVEDRPDHDAVGSAGRASASSSATGFSWRSRNSAASSADARSSSWSRTTNSSPTSPCPRSKPSSSATRSISSSVRCSPISCGNPQAGDRKRRIPDQPERRHLELRRQGLQPEPVRRLLSERSEPEMMGKYAQDSGLKKVFLMAPNYQAGKDELAGFKRYFKGEVADEVYVPLNQLDYSAELSKIAAASARRHLRVPARRHGRELRQAVPSGRSWPTRSSSSRPSRSMSGTLPAQQDAALGFFGGATGRPTSTIRRTRRSSRPTRRNTAPCRRPTPSRPMTRRS